MDFQRHTSSRKALTGWGDGNHRLDSRKQISELSNRIDYKIEAAYKKDVKSIVNGLIEGLKLSEHKITRRKYHIEAENTVWVVDPLENILYRRAMKKLGSIINND